MNRIAIYSLTSSLHNEVHPDGSREPFIKDIISSLGEAADFCGQDFSSYGTHQLDLIYVRTGGTENAFMEVYPGIKGPVRLLTSGVSNSLAASMEIMSFLDRNGREGEILHGSAQHIAGRIKALLDGSTGARQTITRLGVVGRPSDWLISSDPDREALRTRLGIQLVDIAMEELLEEIGRGGYDIPEKWRELLSTRNVLACCANPKVTADTLEGALNIYGAISRIVERRHLQGLTVRCFDLLGTVGNTGCLALALLNAQGIPAGCEGDIPTLVTMSIANAQTGVSGFQANPSRIDPQSGEMVFAHCTVPFNMVGSCSFDTHFESGIGVAVKGEMPTGPVTIFKLSPDLSRSFICEAELLENMSEACLCRTQVRLKVPQEAVGYFLTRPIGNHHVILPGHCAARLREALSCK